MATEKKKIKLSANELADRLLKVDSVANFTFKLMRHHSTYEAFLDQSANFFIGRFWDRHIGKIDGYNPQTDELIIDGKPLNDTKKSEVVRLLIVRKGHSKEWYDKETGNEKNKTKGSEHPQAASTSSHSSSTNSGGNSSQNSGSNNHRSSQTVNTQTRAAATSVKPANIVRIENDPEQVRDWLMKVAGQNTAWFKDTVQAVVHSGEPKKKWTDLFTDKLDEQIDIAVSNWLSSSGLSIEQVVYVYEGQETKLKELVDDIKKEIISAAQNSKAFKNAMSQGKVVTREDWLNRNLFSDKGSARNIIVSSFVYEISTTIISIVMVLSVIGLAYGDLHPLFVGLQIVAIVVLTLVIAYLFSTVEIQQSKTKKAIGELAVRIKALPYERGRLLREVEKYGPKEGQNAENWIPSQQWLDANQRLQEADLMFSRIKSRKLSLHVISVLLHAIWLFNMVMSAIGLASMFAFGEIQELLKSFVGLSEYQTNPMIIFWLVFCAAVSLYLSLTQRDYMMKKELESWNENQQN